MRIALLAVLAPLVLLGAACGDHPAVSEPEARYEQPETSACRGDVRDAVTTVAPRADVTADANDLDAGGLRSLTCSFVSRCGIRGGAVPTGVTVLIHSDADGDDDARRLHSTAGDHAFVDLLDAPLDAEERFQLADGWWDDGFVRRGSWAPGRPGIGGPGLLSISVASVRDANLNVQVAVTRSGVPAERLATAQDADRELAETVFAALEGELSTSRTQDPRRGSPSSP